jgi:hypothetical protein
MAGRRARAVVDLWNPATLMLPTGDRIGHAERLAAAVDKIRNSLTRGFHYCRLLDEEVEEITVSGVPLPSRDMIEAKADRAVALGHLVRADAQRLLASAFYQRDGLSSPIVYASSRPFRPDAPEFAGFAARWGGEAFGFDPDDVPILGFGRARVLELGFSLEGHAAVAAAEHALSIRSGGWIVLHSKASLPASSVLRVHTEGERDYLALGGEYPDEFGKWNPRGIREGSN